MSIESVKAYFRALQMEERVMEKPTSSATVELAAETVGVIPARIVKTLSFNLDGACLLICAAGDAKVDNAKFKQHFKQKARMLSADEALRMTGHAVGGVCPFAVPEDVQTVLDISMQRFDTVFPAAGSSNSMIELSPDELFTYAKAQAWVDVCKGWQAE